MTKDIIIAIILLLQINRLSEREGAAVMEPLFRANRAILAQKMLTVRFGHNWEKYFIGLFHVSEHVDHFKAIKYFCEKKREIVWSGGTPPTPCLVKYQTITRFFCEGFP